MPKVRSLSLTAGVSFELLLAFADRKQWIVDPNDSVLEKAALRMRMAVANVPIIFYALLFSMLTVAISDAYLFGNRHYIRFRRPDDVWVPPFRTVLCNNDFPIRIQVDADPEEQCRNYMNRIHRSDSYI